MISRSDLQRLIERPADDQPVLSIFLDMSVNSDNKRTYSIFLREQRSRFAELDSDRDKHHREALGEALARVDRWIDESFEPTNKGVAIYASVGGEWFQAFQVPVPVENRFEIAERAIVGPLSRVLEEQRRHAIVMVDREHMRYIDVVMGVAQHEHTMEPDALPTKHDVQAGGYSQANNQRRKLEEMKHFYKDFAASIAEHVRRYGADDLIVVGTEANVNAFLDFLPENLKKRVVHTMQAPIGAPVSDVLERARPFFIQQVERAEEEVVGLLRDRVQQRHFATSGFRDTLEQLQEGKVETLVIARDVERDGAQCTQCNFYMVRRNDGRCPYCGGDTRDEVDLVETMIRMAADQDVGIEFVEPQALSDLNGVGALLRF